MIGRTLGHYRIEEQLGAGGRGVVYRARDMRLERTVAVRSKRRFVMERRSPRRWLTRTSAGWCIGT